MSVSKLKNFLNKEGQLIKIPSKKDMKMVALSFVLDQFSEGVDYTEKEVNEIILQNISFGDYAIIRRELCDLGWLSRDLYGICYQKTKN